jgi:hypothetical protein
VPTPVSVPSVITTMAPLRNERLFIGIPLGDELRQYSVPETAGVLVHHLRFRRCV